MMSRKDKKHAVRVEVEDGAHEAPSNANAQEAVEEQGSTAAHEMAASPEKNDKAATDAAEPTEDELVEAAIAAGDAAADADFEAELQVVEAERDALRAELAELTEKLEHANEAAVDATEKQLRVQADWDNFRKRTAQERLDERARATERLVTNLLPVIDDMERALEHAAGAAEQDENLKQFSEGVAAVRAKMLDILGHEGVEMIDPAGEAFDPLAHQAVGRVENPAVFDETVADVYQKGYQMAGKVIRPAMVTVSFGGERRPTEELPAEPELNEEAETAEKAETAD